MRRLAGLLLVAVMAATTGGCQGGITKEVLFVNDSVTNLSATAIVSEFNDARVSSRETRYAANFGGSLGGSGLLQVPGVLADDVDSYWAVQLTSLMVHDQPEVLVVELGYNDCGHDLTTYASKIDNFMSYVANGVPVYWLTLHDVLNVKTCDEEINAELSAATRRWSSLKLLDFRSFVMPHPTWAPDGTHLDLKGETEYAAWLHRQLDAIYAR